MSAPGPHWRGQASASDGGGRHLRPSYLNPRDLIDHLAKDHGSDPAQCEQAEAMVTGVMRYGQTGPFTGATAGPLNVAQPSGP